MTEPIFVAPCSGRVIVRQRWKPGVYGGVLLLVATKAPYAINRVKAHLDLDISGSSPVDPNPAGLGIYSATVATQDEYTYACDAGESFELTFTPFIGSSSVASVNPALVVQQERVLTVTWSPGAGFADGQTTLLFQCDAVAGGSPAFIPLATMAGRAASRGVEFA